jgi:hypothetical protein
LGSSKGGMVPAIPLSPRSVTCGDTRLLSEVGIVPFSHGMCDSVNRPSRERLPRERGMVPESRDMFWTWRRTNTTGGQRAAHAAAAQRRRVGARATGERTSANAGRPRGGAMN